MSAARFIFVGKHISINVFDSTPKTRPCSPIVTGRASFSGGSTDARIIHNSTVVLPASTLRLKLGNQTHWNTTTVPTRGRNLFAGGIYA